MINFRVRQEEQPPRPVIGFKLEILNGHSIDAPYPEHDIFAMEVSPDPVQIRPKTGSSGDCSINFNTDDSSSDIDEIEGSENTLNPTVIRVQSIDEPDGPDMRTLEVIKVKNLKPQPTSLRGENMQFTRKGFPYSADAYAKTSHLPCNHSGGDF